MAIKGTDVAIAGVGGLFVYAGIRGYSPLKATQNLIQGQPANAGQSVALLGGAGGSSKSANGVTIKAIGAIAQDAMKYEGTPYTWAGKPGTQPMVKGIGPHDCSSLVTWVLCHDLGFTGPGGTPAGWNGLDHGPDTTEYIAWSGAETIGHHAGLAESGDICVWQTHMGICVGNGMYLSAHDPAEGTSVKPISFPGEILFVRRVSIGRPA
jgi:peptidoglycan DL-endopeptidase CwlO